MSGPTVIKVQDSSPFGELTPDAIAWLRRLQGQLNADNYVVRIEGPATEDPEPVVYTDAAGQWRAGRYIGSVALDGVRLDIEPRFPLDVLLGWVDAAFNFIAIPKAAELQRTESFVPWLLALIWSRRLSHACRHGLPSLLVATEHQGLLARGRIDARATARIRQQRPGHLVSHTRDRSLENDIARTLISAENTLRHLTRSDKWQTQPVRDFCARMRSAVGARPRLPTEPELARIRYTPIRLPFKELVALSHRLARRRGFLSSAEAGRAEGILLDVAEIWELFLVNCARAAYPKLVVRHGTRSSSSAPVHLFRSTAKPEVGLGRLYPDILVGDDKATVAVLDAKYKHLAWAPDRPDGVDRGDRYQLAAYLSRFHHADRTIGALLYPEGMGEPTLAQAEQDGPWRTADGNPTHFVRLPVRRKACIEALRELLERA